MTRKDRLIFAAKMTSSLVSLVVGITLVIIAGLAIGDTYGMGWATVYGIFIAICVVFAISYGVSA